jgi:hypothetical protein
MIDLHKLLKRIKNRLIWLVTTNYGRFVLGAILAASGVFSQYGTIDILSTDLLFFEITSALGIATLIGQTLFVFIGSLYLYFTNND